MRYFRRGSTAPFLGLIGILVTAGAVFGVLPVVVLLPSVALLGVLALSFETRIEGPFLRLAVRPIWRKTVDLRTITEVEVTIADNQVEIFGGWSSRENVVSALVASVEGDRSVGNRAVRLHRSDGSFQQVGTFRPTEFVAAVEEARRQSS